MRNPIKAIGHYFVKDNTNKDEDGRDQWQSRTAYVLASMGGAIGFGNVLRFPSQVFNNNGFQWFIPYFLALGLVAIPALILEVALGATFHGGPILSFNAINKRVRGAAIGAIFVSAMVVFYYVPMLAYVLRFFRGSFQSPLPWEGRLEDFFNDDVIRQVDPIPASSSEALAQGVYMSYPGSGLIGEQVGWTALSWFVIWLCIYKGVAVTGKVVYFTMGVPIIMIIVLLVRGVTLPNAVEGLRLYAGSFHAEKLAGGQIWQAALGQVFYSTGVGFGYYTTYASYNALNANPAADAIIIACSNSLYEITAGFAVFGIVGYIGLVPDPDSPIGSFSLGFLTLPEGLAQMPGAQVWSALFFFTLFLVAVSSAFVLHDVLVTTTCDTNWGRRTPRIYITTGSCIIGFLISMMYNTQFGYYLLDGIDTAANNFVLPGTVFAECYGASVIYRCIDVFGQVGIPAFAVHQFGFLGGLFFGLLVAHQVQMEAGLGVGFGLWAFCTVLSVLIAKHPDSQAPGFWGRNPFLNKLWWLAFYSGSQLRKDLNVTVGVGKSWPLPAFWSFCMHYISIPAVSIIISFGYPSFMARRYDPMHIFGFSVAHLAIFCILSTLIIPRWLDPLIPTERREEGDRSYAPQVTLGVDDVRVATGVEYGAEGGFAGEQLYQRKDGGNMYEKDRASGGS